MNLPFALQDSESVLIACRRHWMYLYPRLVGLSLLAIVPVVVLTAGLRLGPGLDGTLLWIVIVVDAVWVALWLVRLYFTWFRYNDRHVGRHESTHRRLDPPALVTPFLHRRGCSGPSTRCGMPPARRSRALRSSSDAASIADALGRLARAPVSCPG